MSGHGHSHGTSHDHKQEENEHKGHNHGDSHAGHNHGDAHKGHNHGDAHKGHNHNAHAGHNHSHGHDHGGGHGHTCSHHHGGGDGPHLLEGLKYLPRAWQAKNTDLRWLLVFCVFMSMYSAYEIIYGLWTGEYEFINTGFNYGFRAIIIAVSISAAVFVELSKTDQTSTYGYIRIELLAVFSASACLYIMSVF